MSVNTATLKEAMLIGEQLSPADQLRLIGWLSERLHRVLSPSSPPRDLLASAGLGAEIWRDLDVEAYLRQERAS